MDTIRQKKAAVTQALINYILHLEQENILSLFGSIDYAEGYNYKKTEISNMRILVDTCVWSEALRRQTGEESDVSRELHCLILEHRVEIIGSIRQELLSGLREDTQFERLKEHLEAFPDITLEAVDHITAAEFFNKCRANGIQGSNTDCLIFAVAVRRVMAVYGTDRAFQTFIEYLPIFLQEARRLDPRDLPFFAVSLVRRNQKRCQLEAVVRLFS